MTQWDRKRAKEREARWRRNKRRAILDRICCYCQINDTEVVWSLNYLVCSACEQQRDRKAICKCKRFLLRTRHNLCVSCDVKIYYFLGCRETILLSPEGTPSRERIIWRPCNYSKPEYGRQYQEIMVATPKQWRTLR